jgi:hypothetical protein
LRNLVLWEADIVQRAALEADGGGEYLDAPRARGLDSLARHEPGMTVSSYSYRKPCDTKGRQWASM